MKLNRGQLQPLDTPLIGFGGKQVNALGKISTKQTKESPQNKEDVHSPGSSALATHGEASSSPPSSSPLRNHLKIPQKHETHEQTSNETKETEVR
jgi:hypothetical protein